MFKPLKIKRRQFLRGSCYTLALPFLESLFPYRIPSAAAEENPIKFISYYWGNGSYTRQGENFFFPTGDAVRDWNLPPAFQRMAEHRSDIIIFEGLSAPCIGGSIHERSTEGYLTGNRETNVSSLDQIYAEKMKMPVPSIIAEVVPGRGSISRANGNGLPKTGTSRDMFVRIFVDGPGGKVNDETPEGRRLRSLNTKLLDNVLDDIKRYKTHKLNPSDKQRLDQYLTSIEEIQRSVASGGGGGACQQFEPARFLGDAVPNAGNSFGDLRMRNYLDIIVAAMQCDLTNTATIMLWGSGSHGRTYRDFSNFVIPVGARTDRDLHSISHGFSDQYRAITEWCNFQAAEAITRAKNTRTATGTLFDSLLLHWGSASASTFTGGRGDRGHSKKNVPLMLSGRANGKLTAHLGKRLKYRYGSAMGNRAGDYESYETPRANVLQKIADILDLNYQVPRVGVGRRIDVFANT